MYTQQEGQHSVHPAGGTSSLLHTAGGTSSLLHTAGGDYPGYTQQEETTRVIPSRRYLIPVKRQQEVPHPCKKRQQEEEQECAPWAGKRSRDVHRGQRRGVPGGYIPLLHIGKPLDEVLPGLYLPPWLHSVHPWSSLYSQHVSTGYITAR